MSGIRIEQAYERRRRRRGGGGGGCYIYLPKSELDGKAGNPVTEILNVY